MGSARIEARVEKPHGIQWRVGLHPDKPNSRLQKYRLTDKGRSLLDTPMKKGLNA